MITKKEQNLLISSVDSAVASASNALAKSQNGNEKDEIRGIVSELLVLTEKVKKFPIDEPKIKK